MPHGGKLVVVHLLTLSTSLEF